tara:strand:+ start:1339 stop:1560 length:222 start_codon:yes stop_codon:yes gene_type:complete
MNIVDNDKISTGFDVLDEAMEQIVNEYHLNFYEILTILAMMDSKVKQNNTTQFLLETVTRFQEQQNKEDEELR